MAFNTEKLAATLNKISRQAVIQDARPLDQVRYFGAFDCGVHGRQIVGSVVVVDAKTMEVVERQTIVRDSPMPYVPGYSAFREGPLVLELYYSLEHEPDILIVDGEGIAHPDGGGMATYVGVELAKPTIGVVKELYGCGLDGDSIILDGKVVGVQVRTKEHAKPLFVSPGNMITIESAASVIRGCVRPPHKLPEPLHIAHRIASKAADDLRNKVTPDIVEPDIEASEDEAPHFDPEIPGMIDSKYSE